MKIDDFLDFEPVGERIADLETPTPLIDADVVERNLQRWQERCDKIGIANWPHIKTHKLTGLARYQLALGAKGITVQKVGEAEVMADAGIENMLLTFNIVGAPKLKRLAAVMKRSNISVVADNSVVVAGLGSAAREAGRTLKVLVETDTGAGRNGVQSPEAAAALAREIENTDGLSYGGLMTYSGPGQRFQAQAFMAAARDIATADGLKTETVSMGGSPDMWKDDGLEGATEYRAGTNIYFDRSLVNRGTCTWDDCALKVLATIVSTPTDERALIDAGSKALTMDLLGLEGYGVIRSLNDAIVYDLNEEHGYVNIAGASAKPAVGDLVHVVPNHACPVTNLYDHVVFHRGDRVLGAVKVDARGKVH